MPLSHDDQLRVDDYLESNPDAGRRRIAYDLDLPEKQVRTYLERRRELPWVPPVTVKVWDLETTDFKPDIGRIVVATFYDMGTRQLRTRTALDFDTEAGFIQWVVGEYEDADVLVGHNSVAFDKIFLTGVYGRTHPGEELAKRIHWDTYLIARYGWKGGTRYSLENLADHFRLPMQKDHPSKHDWREMISGDPEAVERIVGRCESDVLVTAMLFDRLRPYLARWKGQV